MVPSQFMRDLFQKEGFIFTDFQKATLIWNMPGKYREEILRALEELAESTEDAALQKQIRERIDYEEEKLRKFKDNSSGRYVYVTEDEDRSGCGFFAGYDFAYEYLLKYMKEHEAAGSIKKQLVIREQSDLRVRSQERWNPNLFPELEEEKYTDYEGLCEAEIDFDTEGRMRHIWSGEMSGEEEKRVDAFRTDRFERQFIRIPFAGRRGVVVKDITDGTFGVLEENTKDWDTYMQEIEDKELYVDFSDVQVKVYFLNQHGIWVHEHINPMYLELGDYPVRDDEKAAGLTGLKQFMILWYDRYKMQGNVRKERRCHK